MKDADILDLLSPPTPRAVRVFPTLPSTNTTLREWAEEGAPHGAAVIAEAQTAGRGRLGRAFASPKGAGLYISMLVRRPIPAERLPLLTPYAAVAAARAIEACADVRVGIKWVNDLRIGERKIAGILTEGGLTEKGALSYTVVGIGINLSSNALPSELSGIAAAIGDYAPPPSPARLAAELLDRFFFGLDGFEDGSFLGEYRSRSVVLGREVIATVGEQTLTGKAIAIADDGALILESEGKTMRLGAGEVSIKL